MTVPSFQAELLKIRNELIEKQILVKENEQFVMTQDHVFGSASAAASVLLGRNTNGRAEWKDAEE